MSIKKRGGIWFVRIGSHRFQYTKSKTAAQPALSGGAELCALLLAGGAALVGFVDAFARLGGF